MTLQLKCQYPTFEVKWDCRKCTVWLDCQKITVQSWTYNRRKLTLEPNPHNLALMISGNCKKCTIEPYHQELMVQPMVKCQNVTLSVVSQNALADCMSSTVVKNCQKSTSLIVPKWQVGTVKKCTIGPYRQELMVQQCSSVKIWHTVWVVKKASLRTAWSWQWQKLSESGTSTDCSKMAIQPRSINMESESQLDMFAGACILCVHISKKEWKKVEK